MWPMTSDVDNQLLDLISRAAAGEGQAFETLHERFNPLILRVIRRYVRQDVEDVSQQVWISVRQSLSRFDPGISGFPGWVGMIAARKALTVAVRTQRQAGGMHSDPTRFQPGSASADTSPGAGLDRAETQAAIRECAARLRGRPRQVFEMVCMEGMSRSTVAHVLGISEKRVRGALVEARAKLLECLRKKGVF